MPLSGGRQRSRRVRNGTRIRKGAASNTVRRPSSKTHRKAGVGHGFEADAFEGRQGEVRLQPATSRCTPEATHGRPSAARPDHQALAHARCPFRSLAQEVPHCWRTFSTTALLCAILWRKHTSFSRLTRASCFDQPLAAVTACDTTVVRRRGPDLDVLHRFEKPSASAWIWRLTLLLTREHRRTVLPRSRTADLRAAAWQHLHSCAQTRCPHQPRPSPATHSPCRRSAFAALTTDATAAARRRKLYIPPLSPFSSKLSQARRHARVHTTNSR